MAENARMNRLIERMTTFGLDGLALNPGPSQAYLIGTHFYLFERPIVVLFSPLKPPALVLPALEVTKAQGSPLTMELFPYQDNPATWQEAFTRAFQYLGWTHKHGLKIGIEEGTFRLLEARFFHTALPDVQLVNTNLVAGLRIQKDEDEIARIRQAVKIAEAGMAATLPLIKIGMTEQELSVEFGLQFLRAGSEFPTFPIVASGPNGANPHASVSNRKLAVGDLLVVDFGASFQGYLSDITRTFAVGEVEPEFEQIARITAEANAAGRATARPGIRAGDVDRATRQVIEQAGYGPYFTHRTGHGLGSEVHEEPYIFAENDLHLEPGMVFTVEPGIYLPQRGGVRVEDDVLITAQGSESLSSIPRKLLVVG